MKRPDCDDKKYKVWRDYETDLLAWHHEEIMKEVRKLVEERDANRTDNTGN